MSRRSSSPRRHKRPRRDLEVEMPRSLQSSHSIDLEDYCTMKLNGTEYSVKARQLVRIQELGRGLYGVVETMKHEQSGYIMAVKRITPTDIYSKKQSRLEVEACAKSFDCSFMVTFHGAMYSEGDIWLCMEVMDFSLDKFYRMVVDLNRCFPEEVLARIAYSIVEALHYMKENMAMMHRDIKPSNILLGRNGTIKLCDFGISGQLRDSVAKTVQAGCKPYMAPERVDPKSVSKESYDVRSDVWSLGISVVEVATGAHPYSRWKTPFQQLKQVVEEPSPSLPIKNNFSEQPFSHEMREFISNCLQKDHKLRPKYLQLLADDWIKLGSRTSIKNVADFIAKIERNMPKDYGDFARNVMLEMSENGSQECAMEMDAS